MTTNFVVTPSLGSISKGLKFGEANADKLFRGEVKAVIITGVVDTLRLEAQVLNSRGGYQATVVQMDLDEVDVTRTASACGCEARGGCYHGAALAWWWLLQ